MIKKLLIIPLLSYPLLAVSLTELVAIGLQKSTATQKSQLDIDYAKEQRKESHAQQLGSIGLVANYTYFNLPRTLAPLTPVTMKDPTAAASIATTKNLFGTGIAYNVPLFTGYAQTKQIEIDALATQIAQSKSALTKEQLVFNIRSLYLTILATQEMYQAQETYVGRLEILENLIRTEVALGKKANIDLVKAQSEYQANLSYLDVIKGDIAITKASLASLVGIEQVKTVESVKVTVAKPHQEIHKLLNETTDIDKVRIGELNLKKAGKAIEKSRSSTLPQVSLSSYYGQSFGPNDGSNPNSGVWENEENWQVGLSASWTLHDFGKADAATQKAKIAQMQSRLEHEQILLDLRKSLVEGSEKLKQAYAGYLSNLQQLSLAKESEKIESVRYQSDDTTLNDLLYAKSKTNLATAKLIESKYNYQKGQYYMDYLLERGAK